MEAEKEGQMSQELIVYAIVAVAALYIGRTIWNATRGQSDCGCGKDGGCSSKAASKSAASSSTRSLDEMPPLVQITTRNKTRR
jgi:hypothetical protein